MTERYQKNAEKPFILVIQRTAIFWTFYSNVLFISTPYSNLLKKTSLIVIQSISEEGAQT